MALSAFSWQLGFTIGPPLGGFLLGLTPTGLWITAALVCLVASAAALALERGLPEAVRRSPHTDRAEPTAPGPVAAPAQAG